VRRGSVGYAAISGTDGPQVVVPGNAVGSLLVRSIEAARVVLEVDGEPCAIVLYDDGPRAPEVPPAAVAAEVVVSWSALEAELQGSFSRLRVIPHEENGRVVGVRVYGVRPDHPLARLGLRNGDTIVSFDGRSVSEPDVALEAYAAARGGGRHVVTLVRAGQRIEVPVRIEP
jgi:type II secretory pathway component PulC